jgi:hypothetical protein
MLTAVTSGSDEGLHVIIVAVHDINGAVGLLGQSDIADEWHAPVCR